MKIAINRYHWIVTYLVGLVTIALLGFPSIVGAEELSNPPILAKVAPLSAESFVATAVARTGPAVVRIDTETVVTRRVDPFFDDPFFRDFFGTLPT
ncbi:MAG: serine protease, partial [Microcystaceae cyanobacterium]